MFRISRSCRSLAWLLLMLSLAAAGQKAIDVTPMAIKFPKTVYSNISTTIETVTITNVGTSDLHIGNITYSNQFSRNRAVPRNCPDSNFTLAPLQSCAVGSSFRPTLNGALDGFVNIEHDGSNLPSPLAVQISATGVPSATPSVKSLDFGTVAVGATSAAKTVDVKNNNTVTAAILASATGNYSVTPNGCSNVAPGAICTLTVTFKPTVSDKVPGSLGLFSGAAVPPVKLSGVGSGTVMSPVTFSPASVSFGHQAQGLGLGSPKIVTLANTGATSLTINSVTNSDYGVISTVPNSRTTCTPGTIVNSGGTCMIEVSFNTPGSVVPASYVGAITVADSTSPSPHVFAVTGTDTANPLASPPVLRFPSTPIRGISPPQTVTLTNLHPDPIKMDFEAGADYHITSGCPPPPSTLASGYSCEVTVEFTPAVVGTPNGAINECLSIHSQSVPSGQTGLNDVNLLGVSTN